MVMWSALKANWADPGTPTLYPRPTILAGLRSGILPCGGDVIWGDGKKALNATGDKHLWILRLTKDGLHQKKGRAP